MKTDKVTFGQTYLQKSYFKYLSLQTQNKLIYSYGLGELFPIDMSLGANKKGNIMVKLRACNPWDHIIINNYMPLTPQNISLYSFMKTLENIGQKLHGNKIPFKTYEIKNPKSMTQEDISYVIRDKIVQYIKDFGNYFCN